MYKCGDTDFFKLEGNAEYDILTIDVDTSTNVTFDIIDENGIPVNVGIEKQDNGCGKIKLDLSNGKVYYLRLTTGIEGDFRYVAVGYGLKK